MTTCIGYHFSAGREAYGSQRKIKVGVTLRVKPPLRMCEHGLHWSKRPLDALGYGSGRILSIVEASGLTLHDTDKSCSEIRTHVQVFDANNVLHEFGCWCAEQALKAERKAGREPDRRSWEAIRIKRRWLKGQATDKELTAARTAARAAATDAARDAAWAAARAAARAAATAAATAAVRDAAWDAAWTAATAAATDAAWAAAWAAYNRKLTAMLKNALRAQPGKLKPVKARG